jgi:DNA replication protein DnaC
MHEVMQRHLTDCIFARVPDIVDDSRHEDTDGKHQFSRREYSTCGLLVMDDLGKERINAFASETLWKVVDSRYQASRPLVITTNLTETSLLNAANDMAARDCWDSIISRLAEMCREIRCTASDYRLEKS